MGEKVTSVFEHAIDVLGRKNHVSNARFLSYLEVFVFYGFVKVIFLLFSSLVCVHLSFSVTETRWT